MSSDFHRGLSRRDRGRLPEDDEAIHDVRFDNSFSFIFSPAPASPAANLHDDTPHEVSCAACRS